MKAFLDTNVILDLLDDKRGFHAESTKCIASLIEQNCKIIIAEDMLTTIYYITKRKQEVLEFFETIMEEWQVLPFGEKIIKEAIAICKNHQNLDLEDVLQSLLAKSQKCDVIYTNDKDFYSNGIEIKSTF